MVNAGKFVASLDHHDPSVCEQAREACIESMNQLLSLTLDRLDRRLTRWFLKRELEQFEAGLKFIAERRATDFELELALQKKQSLYQSLLNNEYK